MRTYTHAYLETCEHKETHTQLCRHVNPRTQKYTQTLRDTQSHKFTKNIHREKHEGTHIQTHSLATQTQTHTLKSTCKLHKHTATQTHTHTTKPLHSHAHSVEPTAKTFVNRFH